MASTMVPFHALWCGVLSKEVVKGDEDTEIFTEEGSIIKDVKIHESIRDDSSEGSTRCTYTSNESGAMVPSSVSAPVAASQPSKKLPSPGSDAWLELYFPAGSVATDRNMGCAQDSATQSKAIGCRCAAQNSAAISGQSAEIVAECSGLPLPRAPQGVRPLTSQRIAGTTLSAIWNSLQATESPVQNFMRDVMNCSHFQTSPWAADQGRLAAEQNGGIRPRTFFRRSRYQARLPADVPRPVMRLMGLPESVDAHSLFAMRFAKNEICLVQESFIQGIMYSDRFHLRNLHSFSQDGDGCVLSQWTEVIWTKPLPWTHGPVKIFVEKKAKSEAKDTFRDFARIIQEAASQY